MLLFNQRIILTIDYPIRILISECKFRTFSHEHSFSEEHNFMDSATVDVILISPFINLMSLSTLIIGNINH